jgi:flagellar protein FliS
MAIIAELQGSLDLDQGGEVARELDRLYVWMTDRLTDATVRQDARPIDEVIHILNMLADAWRTIASGQAPEPPR